MSRTPTSIGSPSTCPVRIYLSLGSNLGDREANLSAAIVHLAAPDLQILRVSPVYETEPVDYTDQPQFLNAVLEAETELTPEALLARIGSIENELGRQRSIPKGPRAIDIDILLYGDLIIDQPNLQIPHPRMAERRFVLSPLADLAPDLIHPAARRTVTDLLESAPPAAVRRTDIKVR